MYNSRNVYKGYWPEYLHDEFLMEMRCWGRNNSGYSNFKKLIRRIAKHRLNQYYKKIFAEEALEVGA